MHDLTTQAESIAAEKSRVDAEARQRAMDEPYVPVTPRGRVTDLHARLIAYAQSQGHRTNPVMDSVRRQVKDLVQSMVGPKPVAERNRQGMVQAYASRTNHLGQYQPFYTGTVDPKTIAHRRARNKMARKTRQAQRRAHG